jgi:hypothetical protein
VACRAQVAPYPYELPSFLWTIAPAFDLGLYAKPRQFDTVKLAKIYEKSGAKATV